MKRAHHILITLLATLIFAGVAMAQVDCADWNTQRFFEAATVQEIEDCLEAGKNPTQQDSNGRDPLYWAVRYGTSASVEVLLRKGAYPLTQYYEVGYRAGHTWAWTPLHFAAEFAMTDTVMLLIDTGEVPVDIRSKRGRGETALHIAVERGAAELVQALMNRGADINLRDRLGSSVAIQPFGRTPLHIAVAGGSLEIVTMLIGAGANINAVEGPWKKVLGTSIPVAYTRFTSQRHIGFPRLSTR